MHFAGFIREIHGHHLIHDTILSQETSGLINAGYAALFEIALPEKTPHGCLHWKLALPVSLHAIFRVCK
jgi:hypothetical protein